MRMLWWLPLTILAIGAGALLRARRHRPAQISLPVEPVSGDWLAQARGREEQEW